MDNQFLDPLTAGWRALAAGEWEEAHVHFEEALRQEESGAALEGLGWTAWWLNDVPVTFRHDTATARQLGAQARELAGLLGAVDLQMLAQASLGLAIVCEGNIAEGMRLLDEATAAAVSGEMTDPDAIVTTCCYLISACERVRDHDRAAQWCARAIRLADRWSYRFMFAYCRTHYAGVLIWRGAWPEAEAELETATSELAATFPAMAAEGIARLAEHRVERVDGLELLARAQAAHGDHGPAVRTMAELQAITAAIATPSLRAGA